MAARQGRLCNDSGTDLPFGLIRPRLIPIVARMNAIRRQIVMGQRALDLMDEKNVGLIAAGVAFYAILSLFPGLAALIALWGVIGDPSLVLAQLQEFDALLPEEVEAIIGGQLEALAGAGGLTLGWASILSLLLAIWSARAGVAALMRGLNAIYGVPNRSGVGHYSRALVLTLALIGVALTALVCIVIIPVILAFFPLGGAAQIVLDLARWALSLGVLLCGFALVFRLGPNLRAAVIWPGAFFATFLWAMVSAGFSIYLANFASYNEVYGSIGAVIALLMWLFLSAWLVLLGAALNAWLGQRNQPEPSRQD